MGGCCSTARGCYVSHQTLLAADACSRYFGLIFGIGEQSWVRTRAMLVLLAFCNELGQNDLPGDPDANVRTLVLSLISSALSTLRIAAKNASTCLQYAANCMQPTLGLWTMCSWQGSWQDWLSAPLTVH